MKTLFILISASFLSLNIYSQPGIEWQKCYGGSKGEMASSVWQTSEGGYIIAGRTDSNDGNVSGNHGGMDYWIVKVNGSGDLEWQKCLGGSMSEFAYSIHQTYDGGYIVAGGAESHDGNVTGLHWKGYGQIPADYWIVKLDSSGSIQWQKCLGGFDQDDVSSVRQTADSGYIVAGYTLSDDGDVTGFHPGLIGCYCWDYWIVKLDMNGQIEWQECLGGSNVDQAYASWQTFDGGFIVAGYTQSNDGNVSGNHGTGDFWVVKLEETVGLKINSADNLITIYPNPASDYIVIETRDNIMNAVFSIFDIMGRPVIKYRNINDKQIHLDIHGLTPGIYSILLELKNNTRVSGVFAVTR